MALCPIIATAPDSPLPNPDRSRHPRVTRRRQPVSTLEGVSRCQKGERDMKTQSWIRRITFPTVAVTMALTATLLTGAWPSVAQAATMSESSMRGMDAHHGGAGDHHRPSGDWDHHHHF